MQNTGRKIQEWCELQDQISDDHRRVKSADTSNQTTRTPEKNQMTTTKSNDSEILTMDQAGAILSLSRRTIQNKIRSGEIRAYRASQRIVRLRMSDINDYLDRFATLPAKP